MDGNSECHFAKLVFTEKEAGIVNSMNKDEKVWENLNGIDITKYLCGHFLGWSVIKNDG